MASNSPPREEDVAATLAAVEATLDSHSTSQTVIKRVNKDLCMPSDVEVAEVHKLDTFTCFPRLPTELRFKIWRIAARFPRIIMPSETIQVLSRRRHGDMGSPTIRIVVNKSASPQAAILQACQESRKECLPLYQLSFGTKVYTRSPWTWPSLLAHHEPTIHFSHLRDTIYMTRRLLDRRPEPKEKNWRFWFRWEYNLSPTDLNLSPKSVAFDVAELVDDVESILAENPVIFLDRYFRDHPKIEVVILIVNQELGGIAINGELEFVEIHENADMTKANKVLRGFIVLFDRLAKEAEDLNISGFLRPSFKIMGII